MDLKPLITLLAIVNPLAIVPFFIHYTQGLFGGAAAQHHPHGGVCVVLRDCGLCAAGLQILEFFNIAAEFQVGGGMLLLISAMNMLNAQPAEAKAQHQ